jgi:hypothetical protein
MVAKRLVLFAFLAAIPGAAPAFAGPHKGVVGKFQPATPVVISGKLVTAEGQPAADREIHFENTVSSDVFLTHTGKDGSFSFALPPATYNLREEQGPIVARNVQAWGDEVNLGTVSEPSGWQRILQYEGIAPALVHSPAPITSNVRAGQPIQSDRIPASELPPH